MKYKIKYPKNNLALMSMLIIFGLFTCIIWYNLKEYAYCFGYLITLLILSYTYYFTYYYLKNDYLQVRLGFIILRFKYQNIKDVIQDEDKIKIKLKKISFCIYPKNIDNFYFELKKRCGK